MCLDGVYDHVADGRERRREGGREVVGHAVDGEPLALATNWALNLTVKPQGEGDNAALIAITSWAAWRT